MESVGRGRGTQPDHACAHDVIPQTCQVLKSHGQDYLVGNRLSRADIHLVELLYYVEELDPSLMANFPLLKVISLTAFRREGSHLPLQNLTFTFGSHRCPGLGCPHVSSINYLLGAGRGMQGILSCPEHLRWMLPQEEHFVFTMRRTQGSASVSPSPLLCGICPWFLWDFPYPPVSFSFLPVPV